MNKTFVIILNFNGGEDVIKCLDSIRKEEKRIIVVDNRSTDGSVELIRKNFPKVKIIEDRKNLGFAKGCNVGIRYALKEGVEAIFLLNQDTVVEKKFLGSFLKPLIKNPADIVAPVIKFKRAGCLRFRREGQFNFRSNLSSRVR